MKYFLDQEFLEGTQTRRYLGMPSNIAFPLLGIVLIIIACASMYFEAVTWAAVLLCLIASTLGSFGSLKPLTTKPTIDFISIGIVAEDGRELYLISKDFNLREAWYRWQQRTGQGDRNNTEPREYWIRENVLEPIWKELSVQDMRDWEEGEKGEILNIRNNNFKYKDLKYLINKYGHTNAEIAEKVKEFCIRAECPDFYGHMCDADYMALTWVFGGFNNWPKMFPYYFIDLQQMLDEKSKTFLPIEDLKALKDYPADPTFHHALLDARWNKELYHFIEKL